MCNKLAAGERTAYQLCALSQRAKCNGMFNRGTQRSQNSQSSLSGNTGPSSVVRCFPACWPPCFFRDFTDRASAGGAGGADVVVGSAWVAKVCTFELGATCVTVVVAPPFPLPLPLLVNDPPRPRLLCVITQRELS